MTTTIIPFGVVSYSLTVSSGDDLQVQSGGDVQFVRALSGSEIQILTGGQVFDAGYSSDVALGGEVLLQSGSLLWGDPYVPAGGELLGPGNVDGYTLLAGTASGVIIGSGADHEAGRLEIVSGGSATDITLRWGEIYIDAGATVSGAVMESNPEPPGGGYTSVQGLAIDVRVNSGDYEFVQSGGVTSGAEIALGGFEIVSGGGTARGDFISSGGTIDIKSGGVAYSTSLENGGAEIVESGAATSNATVGCGASATIRGAGSDKFAKIWNGGAETVLSGGVVLYATVSHGGDLVISSGGMVGSSLTLVGGEAEVAGAVTSGTVVTFVGAGGDLALEDPATFAGVISGLTLSSQQIDLAGFAYGGAETVSWTPAQGGLSGTLTVIDGANQASLTLAGAYVTSNFVLSNDRHGGTFVVDPRAASPGPVDRAVARLAQAVSLFADGSSLGFGGAASISPVSAALSDAVGLALGR